MSSLIYTLIANKLSPLAEVALADGNFQLMALKLLAKTKPDTSVAYSYDNQYVFHYHNEQSITFLCLSDAGYSKRMAYEFLYDIRDRFFTKFGSTVREAIAYSADKEFKDELKGRMIYFNSDSSADRLRSARVNIDRTKDIMIENIDKVLARGEKIELLVTKTGQMADEAVTLKRTATKVKRSMWWQNFKLKILIAFIVVILLYAIAAYGCGGFTVPECR
jgi:vesicle-associated membrane protein 7